MTAPASLFSTLRIAAPRTPLSASAVARATESSHRDSTFDDALSAVRQHQDTPKETAKNATGSTSAQEETSVTDARKADESRRAKAKAKSKSNTDESSTDETDAPGDASPAESSGDGSEAVASTADDAKDDAAPAADDPAPDPATAAAAASLTTAAMLATPQTAQAKGDAAGVDGQLNSLAKATKPAPQAPASTHLVPEKPEDETPGLPGEATSLATKAGKEKPAKETAPKPGATESTPAPGQNGTTAAATPTVTTDDATAVGSAAPAPAPGQGPSAKKAGKRTENPSDTQSAAASGAAPASDSTTPAATAAIPVPAAMVTDAAHPSSHETSTLDPAARKDASSTAALPTATAGTPAKAQMDRAASATPAQDSPASDAQNTFDQIVLGLRGKLDARNGKAEIRLDPPNLGTVRVSVNLQNGLLTAQFQSSSQQVRDLLQSNMEKLKTTLESQGVTVDKLAVDSAGAKVPAPVSTAPVNTNAAANDGRSAGQYYSSGGEQKRSTKDQGAFTKVWRDTADAAPIDLVA